MKFFINLICMFIPKKKWREYIRAYLGNYFFGREIVNLPSCRDFKDFQIIHYHLGEAVIFCLTIESWYKGGMVVVTKPYHKKLFDMICPNIPCVLVSRPKYCYLSLKKFHYGSKRLSYVWTEENLKLINFKKKNFYEGWKEFINNEQVYKDKKKINVSYKTEQEAKNKLKRLKIDVSKLFFVSPEALSIEPLPEQFWHRVIDFIRQNGYDVYVNKTTGTRDEILSIDEAYYVASKSKMIVGMRSGLMDLLCMVNVPLRIIYTYSDYYNDLQPMYSLFKHPFCYYDLKEFNALKMSEETILEEILSDILRVIESNKKNI